MHSIGSKSRGGGGFYPPRPMFFSGAGPQTQASGAELVIAGLSDRLTGTRAAISGVGFKPVAGAGVSVLKPHGHIGTGTRDAGAELGESVTVGRRHHSRLSGVTPNRHHFFRPPDTPDTCCRGAKKGIRRGVWGETAMSRLPPKPHPHRVAVGTRRETGEQESRRRDRRTTVSGTASAASEPPATARTARSCGTGPARHFRGV